MLLSFSLKIRTIRSVVDHPAHNRSVAGSIPAWSIADMCRNSTLLAECCERPSQGLRGFVAAESRCKGRASP